MAQAGQPLTRMKTLPYEDVVTVENKVAEMVFDGSTWVLDRLAGGSLTLHFEQADYEALLQWSLENKPEYKSTRYDNEEYYFGVSTYYPNINNAYSTWRNYYNVNGEYDGLTDDQLQAIMELARRLLAEDMQKGVALTASDKVKDYLRLYFSRQSHESFVVLFLDVGNKLIACTEMFRGTLSHTSVYPREVVKAALACNAASVIFAHNHPSGTAKPSQADKTLTHLLRQALGLVDIRVLDHVIVAGNETFSFAERGLM